MKDLLIIGLGSYPNNSAGAKRVYYYSKMLENSFNVRILTPFPIAQNTNRSFLHEINYEYAINFIPSKFLNRLINLSGISIFFLIINLIKQNKKFKSCILYTRGFFPTFSLFIFLKIMNKRIFFEINELPYFNEGKIGAIKRYISFYSYFIWGSGIIVISKKLYDFFYHKFKFKRIIQIPILVECFLTKNINNIKFLEKPFIFHSGSFSPEKDGAHLMIDSFIYASKKLSSFGINLNFITTNFKVSERHKSEIILKIKKNNLENSFLVINNLIDDEIFSYQSQSSVLLLIKPDNEQNRFNFSTKLGEYLASKRPVIAVGKENEMFNYLIHNKNSILINEFSVEIIGDAIVQLILDEESSFRIGIEGFHLANKMFSPENYKTDFNNFIHEKRL